ncbi:TPA: hypothetical protein ACXYOX_004238 [Escherichia coli]
MEKTTFALMTALAALTSTHAFAAEQIAQLCTSEEIQGVHLVTLTKGNNPQFVVQKGGAILAGELKPVFTPLILTENAYGYEFNDGTQTQTVRGGKYIVKDNKTNRSTVFDNCMSAPQTLVNLSQGKPSGLPAGTNLEAYMRQYTDAFFEQQRIFNTPFESQQNMESADSKPQQPTAEDLKRWADFKVLADKNDAVLGPINAANWDRREKGQDDSVDYTKAPSTCDLMITAKVDDKSNYKPIAYVKSGIKLAPEGDLLRAIFKPAFNKKTEAFALVYITRHSVPRMPNVFPDTHAIIDVPADKDIAYEAWNCK